MSHVAQADLAFTMAEDDLELLPRASWVLGLHACASTPGCSSQVLKNQTEKTIILYPHLQAVQLRVVWVMDKLRKIPSSKGKFYGESLPLYLESTDSLWIGSLPFLPAAAQGKGKLVFLTVIRRAGLLRHLRGELFFFNTTMPTAERKRFLCPSIPVYV